jgi:MFS family permease
MEEPAAHATPTPAPSTPRFRTFTSLRYRDFRYLWTGQIGNSASLWMEQVVRPLLMLHLTDSALQVGSIVAVRSFPQIGFGILAGAMADRYDKRLVLMASQVVTLLTHLTIGLLVVTDRVEIWHVYVTGVVAGAANAFIIPTRQSMVPRIIPREELVNAVALNTAANNLMRIGGASLAGLLLIPFDFGEVYLVNAAIFVGVIWTTTQIPPMGKDMAPTIAPAAPQVHGSKGPSLLSDLLEGFRYMRSNKGVLSLIGAAMILFVLGQPYQQVFVPLLARDELHVGRSMVGLMLAVSGVGALMASITLASTGGVPRRGAVMLTALVGMGLSMVLLAYSEWLWLSMLAILLTGATSVIYLALNNTLLLEQTPMELQGRVVSFLSLDRGLISIGALIGGALAEAYGAPAGLAAMGIACSALAMAAFALAPSLRRMG